MEIVSFNLHLVVLGFRLQILCRVNSLAIFDTCRGNMSLVLFYECVEIR